MSAWKDHTTAALLGAGKVPLPALPASLQPILAPAAGMGSEIQFLSQAGALALWRRSGWQPGTAAVDIVPCDAESTRPANRACIGHLRTMLAGRHAAILPEWLTEAARLGRHLPPEYLPSLLDRARQDRALRLPVIAAGGRRAQWLATQNPHWAYAPTENPDAWETGNREQRVALLRTRRASTPDEARALVEAVWKSEPAELRAAFLAEFPTGLSDSDVPFLEAALDDRSKEVRRATVDLLARLPGSPFVARMTARAQLLLVFKRGGLLSRASLEVTLPGDPDTAAVRDGLDPKAFGQQKLLGEKAVLLALLLSAVPLSHWTESAQADPATLLKTAAKNEFARALTTGWAWAAIRQGNIPWAEALLDGESSPHLEFLPAEPLLSVLPEAARATRLTKMIRDGAMKKAGSAEWVASLAELTVFAERAPAPLVREALTALRASVASGLPWQYRSPVEAWLLRLPAASLSEALGNWPSDRDDIAPFIELLSFRHNALTALAQP